MKMFAKSNLLVLGFALGSLMVAANAVEAATLSYDFEVSNINTGSLSGQTLLGSFSFDDEAPAVDNGFGLDIIALTDFSFSFDNNSFGLGDLTIDSGVAFFEGNFIGLEIFESASIFSIFDDGIGSVFAYDEGFGTVTYTLQPSGPSVPEPATALSLLALGAFGAGATLRRKAA
jgi:hypothetical protein